MLDKRHEALFSMGFNSITSDYLFRNLIRFSSAIFPQSFRNRSGKHAFSALFPQNFCGPRSPLKSLKVLENP